MASYPINVIKGTHLTLNLIIKNKKTGLVYDMSTAQDILVYFIDKTGKIFAKFSKNASFSDTDPLVVTGAANGILTCRLTNWHTNKPLQGKYIVQVKGQDGSGKYFSTFRNVGEVIKLAISNAEI